jgi:hypothetical protein
MPNSIHDPLARQKRWCLILFFSALAAALMVFVLISLSLRSAQFLNFTPNGEGLLSAAQSFAILSSILAPISSCFAISVARSQARFYLIATIGFLIPLAYLSLIYAIYSRI